MNRRLIELTSHVAIKYLRFDAEVLLGVALYGKKKLVRRRIWVEQLGAI